MSAYDRLNAIRAAERNNPVKITALTPPPKGGSVNLYTDGSCPKNPGPMGVGILIEQTAGRTELGFRLPDGTNNEAEYLALIIALRRLHFMGLTHIHAHLDSLLVVNQINGSWKVKKGKLKVLHAEARALIAMFTHFEIKYIPREQNEVADFLSKNPTGDSPMPPPPADEPTVIRFKQKNPQPRKLTRRQAAMIKWWWVTGRCRNEYLLRRIFGLSESLCGRIGRDETYQDITRKDLP